MSDDTVVETIVRAEVFQQFLEQLTTVVDEAVLHIGSDGISTTVVDPANVAMVDIDIGAEALEHAPGGSFTVGANLHRLDDYVSGASGSDPIALAFNTEKRTLNIQHTNREFNVAMIDPDTVRGEPDVPDMDLPVDVTLPGGELVTAIKDADLLTDHVRFEADPDAGAVDVIGEGDIDDVTVRFDGDDFDDGSEIGAGVKALYSVGYMTGDSGLLSGLPSGVDLRWRFDEDHPVKFNYTFADGFATVELMCAPRIQAN